MGFFDWFLQITTKIDGIMWGPLMIGLLLITGIILTIWTRGIQFTHMWHSLKLIFSKESRSEEGKGDISPFAALMTALAATVGNGNIAGVATAIAIGGPGAPVYMWIAGIFGMATKYAEGFLGVQYREVAPNGTMAGGPMYYVKNGLKNKQWGKILGGAFAIFGVIACLIGTGNMAQSNSMTASLANTINQMFLGGVSGEQAPDYYYFIIGAIIALLVGMVIIGGIKKIGHVSEKLVPAMIVFYIFFALWVIIANFDQIPAAYSVIFASAFGLQPLVGASVGLAIQNGVSRGLLSNEAGLGSAAIAQGASASDAPEKNGLIAMTGVFIDTILVNTMTTLTIVLTGAYTFTQAWRGAGVEGNITSILVTQQAFDSVIPWGLGGTIIAFSSFIFGYTTLIGWSYYGEKCIEYLGGDKVIMPFRYTFIAFLFVGAIITPLAGESLEYLNIVWNLGNIGNALMAVPNLIGLLILGGAVAAYFDVFKKYANFSGRARRREYFTFGIFNLVISFFLGFIEGLLGGPGVVAIIYSLAVLIPGIALSVRRLHDISLSGWWLLIIFVPVIGAVVLLILMILKGADEENEFGSIPEVAKSSFSFI